MHSVQSLTQEELKKAMDSIEDPTDSKKEWTARIESFSQDSPAQRAELYKSLASKDCPHSYTMMTEYCIGLNSSQLPIEKRSSYFAQYWEDIAGLLETVSNEVGSVFLTDLMPNTGDHQSSIVHINSLIEKTSNTKFKKKLRAKVDELKKRDRAIKFCRKEMAHQWTASMK